MGEVHIIGVEPGAQRQGVATALIDWAFDFMRSEGAEMAMVETGDDPGHAPSRAVYESLGFDRWPVARYFRSLRDPT
jgi:GNAT superfamily N-acetyltransferase